MANIKISQLPEFTGSTDNSWLILNNSGQTETFKITRENFLSGITTYTEITYSELYSLFTGETLTPGQFYLMTDFQTCYDQPDFNQSGTAIIGDNYKTGSTEPIVVLATSINSLSPKAYSLEYPFDDISYDITFTQTEMTSNPAKGRITERIDDFNNRTDYDHRNILFKRYNGYSYNESQPLSGLVGISGITGTTAVLYGNTGTTFNSNFSTGSLVAVTNIFPSIFEVISVESNSIAIISGVSISNTSNSPYYLVIDDGIISYRKPNVRVNEVFEYTTFGDATSINNYVGNYANLYSWNENPFILANNVFISGSFINNTIGNDSYNNTFNDDCDSNQIGDSFYNNSTNDDFDGNIIGDYFNNNYITSNFNNNRIGSNFNSNILIGGSFYRNNIGNEFNSNVWTNGDFQNNEIGNQFNNNKIYNEFYNNDIGNGYNNNESYSTYNRNLIGNGYNNNTIYSQFYENEIGQIFNNNTISTLLDSGNYDFTGNRIGNDFYNNTIKNDFVSNDILNDFYNNSLYSVFRKNSVLNGFEGNTIGDSGNTITFENNQIMNTFKGNNVQGDFWSNYIKTNFKANQTFAEFGYNNVGYSFFANNMSGQTISNNIGDYFESNNCYGSFSYNTIGTSFSSNDVQDGFGFGGGTYRGNVIGNNFNSNDIGEYFYDNTIGDNFTNNTIVDYFQMNRICNSVISIDFSESTHVYGFYNCEIFTGSGGGQRLSYYDSSDVLNITNITA
jgi:hypothetical protein